MTGCRSARATSTAGASAGTSRPTRRSPARRWPMSPARSSQADLARVACLSRRSLARSVPGSIACASHRRARSIACSTAGAVRLRRARCTRVAREQFARAHEREQERRRHVHLRAILAQRGELRVLFRGLEHEGQRRERCGARGRRQRHPGEEPARARPALAAVHDPVARVRRGGPARRFARETTRGAVVGMLIERARREDQGRARSLDARPRSRARGSRPCRGVRGRARRRRAPPQRR